MGADRFHSLLNHPAFGGMRRIPQWVVWKLVPSTTRPGKFDKKPIDRETGITADGQDSRLWSTPEKAAADARARGDACGIGFVFTEGCGFWFVDLDKCLQPDGRSWSPFAVGVVTQHFPGAALEVSVSGTGLHLFGSGTVPPHGCKNHDHNAELYTSGRFAAMTGNAARGDCMSDHTGAMSLFVAAYFAKSEAAGADLPDEGPREGYTANLTDDEIIDKALNRRGGIAEALGHEDGGVTFRDLWEGNVDALAREWPSSKDDEFDRSDADYSLAFRLAWWTGSDVARVERLMRRSALVRDKWDRRDYIVDRTIKGACTKQTRFYGQRAALIAPGAPAAAPVPTGGDAQRPPSNYVNSDTPLHTARIFIGEQFPGDALRYWQGSYYRWRAGAWQEVGKEDPHAWVYAFLDARPERTIYVPNQANVAKVLDALKAAAHLDSATAPPAWLDAEGGPPPGDLVPCVNGLLHVPTGQLWPPTPRLFNLNALPVAFAPTAPTPTAWLAFLAQVWPGDPEAVQALQELFGYLLTPDTSQQKIFLIVGPRRSGKGTIARILTALLGSGNVASPTLSSMSADFGLQPLVGKLAAVISDARLSGRTDQQAVAENLLRISGEDQVDVNRKFLAPLTLRLGVRFVLLTNELPKIADASGAMASRFVILKMTESFLGREDHGLTARLLQELPGVLNWALQGWHRLRQRGYFTVPRSSAEMAQELADLGSPISAFLRDACTVSPGATVGVAVLYDAWRTWCSHQGLERTGTKLQFCRDLNAALPGVKRTQPMTRGVRVPTYEGVGLHGLHGLHGYFPIAAFPAPPPLFSSFYALNTVQTTKNQQWK